MIVEDVMVELGTKLDEISPLRVLPYDADTIEVPAGLVSLPVQIDYQTSYGSGFNMMRLEITLLVGLAGTDDRVRLEQIAPYADSHGSKSVVAKLQSATYTTFDSLAVLNSRFDVIRIGEIDYLACIFLVDILGPGRA